jgi:hypothetical protein
MYNCTHAFPKLFFLSLFCSIAISSVAQRDSVQIEVQLKFEAKDNSDAIAKVSLLPKGRTDITVVAAKPIVSDYDFPGDIKLRAERLDKACFTPVQVNFDYFHSYNTKPAGIVVHPGARFEQAVDVGSFFGFNKGVYRVKIAMQYSRSGKYVYVESEWLYINVLHDDRVIEEKRSQRKQ